MHLWIPAFAGMTIEMDCYVLVTLYPCNVGDSPHCTV